MRVRCSAVTLLAVSTSIGSLSATRAESGLEGTAYGIIESVREVFLESIPAGFAGVFQHAVRPSDEVVVRLDDGRALTVVQSEPRYFAPGQRVVVLAARRGAKLEHAAH